MEMKLGADPEIALYSTKENAFISAHDLIPGTKEKPVRLRKGAVQVDGTALEFNIDPASSAHEFVDHLETVLKQCKEMLPKNVEMRFVPSVEFSKPYFAKLPEGVLKLGCDPDWNATAGRMVRAPRPQGTLRTYGGHIHVGWGNNYDPFDEEHFYDCRMMTQRLHKYFSFFSFFWDKDKTRQLMYGNGAVFRPKPYGLEYRSLSNAWLNHPELWPWIFDSTKWIMDHAISGKTFIEYNHRYHPENIFGKKHVPSSYDRYGMVTAWDTKDELTDAAKVKAVEAEINFGFSVKGTFPKYPLEI